MPLKTYRVYFLDDANHIVDVAVLRCFGDEEARALAVNRSIGRRTELWRGAAMIGQFPQA